MYWCFGDYFWIEDVFSDMLIDSRGAGDLGGFKLDVSCRLLLIEALNIWFFVVM